MNKNQYAEFHKYLAMIKYDEVESLLSPNLSENDRKDIEKILNAVDLLMKVIIIKGDDKK